MQEVVAVGARGSAAFRIPLHGKRFVWTFNIVLYILGSSSQVKVAEHWCITPHNTASESLISLNVLDSSNALQMPLMMGTWIQRSTVDIWFSRWWTPINFYTDDTLLWLEEKGISCFQVESNCAIRRRLSRPSPTTSATFTSEVWGCFLGLNFFAFISLYFDISGCR